MAAEGSGSQEQPILGRDGAVPRVSTVGHKSQAGSPMVGEKPRGASSPTRKDIQMGMPHDHSIGLQRWFVPGREPCRGHETESRIGIPCRMRLDIYLVGYGGEREEQRERRRKGRSTGKGETEAASSRERDERWEIKGLRLEAISLPLQTGREWAWFVS